MPDLSELLRGEVAGAVMRSVLRDLTLQQRNGRTLPRWPEPVLRALAEAAGVSLSPVVLSAIGPAIGTIDPSEWVTVAVAAERVGRSERQIRRLASARKVLARRVGARSWLIDFDSLSNVLRKRK
jgi:hypothetical protein